MYLPWPNNERCPYCGNKGTERDGELRRARIAELEADLATWKASADRWLARCAELEAKLARVQCLADEWEREGAIRPPGGQQLSENVSPATKRRLRECAAELRECAKETA